MFLVDVKGRIKKKWGGYSPKIYDGHWLKVNKEWLEEKLNGATVVADNHFLWGKKNLKNVKFHCNIREKQCCREEEVEFITNPLSSKVKSYNKAVRNARARYEDTFGEMSTLFDSLAKPWATSDLQQDYLVSVASGILNCKIQYKL